MDTPAEAHEGGKPHGAWATRLVAAVLTLQAGLLAYGATRHSPVIDEVGHLAAGISHWTLGRFDAYAVNPPLVRGIAALPAVVGGAKTDWSAMSRSVHGRPEFHVGEAFNVANFPDALRWYVYGRWMLIPLVVMGGWVCARWADALFGPAAAVTAALLWCLSPMVLANGALLTPDAVATALGMLAAWRLRVWLHRPGGHEAFTAGLTLGLAELAKTTWLVLFVLWPLVALLWRWLMPREEPARDPAPLRRRAGEMALILALAVLTVNVGYGFAGTGRPLGDFFFTSRTLRAPDGREQNRFSGTLLGAVPVPFPSEYVRGIDVQKGDFDGGMDSYLFGLWQPRGWWYYYLVGLAVKVPLGAWLLVGLSSVACLAPGSRVAAREAVLLLAPAAAVLGLVSSQTGFSHHIRYVLPAFPFLIVWAAGAVRVRRRWVRGLAFAAAAWVAASSLRHYPHSLSYFNELAGGPRGGRRILTDSNVDWGQDLPALADWLAEHPEARPLRLAAFTAFDPRQLDIEFSVPSADAKRPASGWVAVSATVLAGRRSFVPDGGGGWVMVDGKAYGYLADHEPVATVGGSIDVFHLPPHGPPAAGIGNSTERGEP